eukprot:gene15854-21983_t
MILPTQPSGISAVSAKTAMLCLLALCTSLSGADAHVFMTAPLSRVRVLGNAEWIAAGGNGLGKPQIVNLDGTLPDVCGDPHQDVGYAGAVNKPQTPTVTYSAGATIQVTQKMNTWHGGYIMIKLCPTARSGATQSCFNQYPLVREYSTANSCVDTCSVAECGKYATNGLDRCGTTAARKEIFRDCADIRITGSGTPSGGSGAPTTPIPTGGSCPAADRADWRCGPNFGNAKCLSGYCCSTGGWCGNTAAHCNPNVCAGSSSSSSATCGTCKSSPCAGGNICDKCNLSQSLGGC